MSDFTETYAHNLLKGILAYSHGKEPWVVCRMPTAFKEEHGIHNVFKWAIKWKADAIIGQFDPDDDLEIFKKHGIFVFAQDYKQRFTSIPNITGKYKEQGRKAADYFVNKGFRYFAFYGYEDAIWSEERVIGFKQRLDNLGFGNNIFDFQKQPLDNLWFYDPTPLSDWIGSLPHPTAIFACDDTRASTLIEICSMLKLKIPNDIAILGVDNDEIQCNLTNPSLSSLNLDVFNAGYDTAMYIDQLVHGERNDKHDIIVGYTNIVERQSTDYFKTNNKYITTILAYIHNNLDANLSVKVLVDLVPLSRRILERTFKKETGLSIHQYILNLRVQRLSGLLLSSNETIADLALQVGLNEPGNVARLFKKYYGVSPLQYRNEHTR